MDGQPAPRRQGRLHDTFIKALRGWDSRVHAAPALAWLYRIATNTAYDELRRRRRTTHVLAAYRVLSDGEPVAMDGRVADADAVALALQAVPPTYRKVLILQTQGGHDLLGIAAQLNVAVGTVKSRLHRARAHFRRAYVEQVPGCTV